MCIVNKFLVCHALLLSPLFLAAALPDLAVVDKLFKEKRYAEALKGYAACEKCQIGERGYVILQTAICAERIGDGVRRGKALRKLCALEPAGADAKYVEAAYRMRYERDVAPSRHTGDLDRFIREACTKFRGGGFAARIATRELEKQVFACNWRQALKSYKAYKVLYAPSVSNAVQIIWLNILKGEKADAKSAGAIARIFADSPSLAEHLANHIPDACRAWLFWDKMADECLRGGKWDKALSFYDRAGGCADCNQELIQYKTISLFSARPNGANDVVARGRAFLRAYPNSNLHFAVCKTVLGSLVAARRFEEAEAFVKKSGFWREPYFTPEVNKLLADLERGKAEAERRRLALQKTDKSEMLAGVCKLREQKRFAEAVVECDRIAALDKEDAPKDAARRIAAQVCFEDLSDYKAAGERYRKLAEAEAAGVRREEDELLFLRAVSCLIICGEVREAHGLLESIKPHKDDLVLKGRLEALAEFAHPAKKSVKAIARLIRTADVLFASGDYGAAIKEYGKVVSAKGADREVVLSARMQVARCLARLREYAKARDAYESLIKTAGRCELSAVALVRLGTIYAGALDDAAGAERCLKRAADEYQGSPPAERALYNLMSFYVMTGKWELAADARLRFLKICKNERIRRIADVEYGRIITNRKIG